MELIKITEYQGEQVVSARELHVFLESKQDFSTWIKNRIEKYGFIEGVDYSTLHKVVERAKRVEYALTTNTAKEIAMVEGNDKGKQARQYFIQCEKAMITSSSISVSPRQLAQMVIDAENAKDLLQLELNNQRPKVLFADTVSESKDSVLIKELAGYLKQKGIDIGQNRLFSWLRNHNYLCQKGEYYNLPTQKALDLKLFEVKKTAINKPDGTILTSTTTKVTGKGLIYFVNKFLIIENASKKNLVN